MMAASDVFEIVVSGRGCHAAMPQLGTDAVLAASAIVSALHTLVGRIVDPREAAVVSVTQLHAGETWNVIPEDALLRGTVRSFKATVQDTLEAAMRDTAEADRCRASLYGRHALRAAVPGDGQRSGGDRARRACSGTGGRRGWRRAGLTPSMGSEDFAFMLRARPGCYVWLGNGRWTAEGCCTARVTISTT